MQASPGMCLLGFKACGSEEMSEFHTIHGQRDKAEARGMGLAWRDLAVQGSGSPAVG